MCAEPVSEVELVAVAGGFDLTHAFERITGIESCLTEEVADLAVLHAAHTEQLEAACPVFAFLGGLAETVRTNRRHHDGLAGGLPRRASDADLNFDDRIARYRMESEGAVHRRMVGPSSFPEPAAPIDDSADCPIELF